MATTLKANLMDSASTAADLRNSSITGETTRSSELQRAASQPHCATSARCGWKRGGID